MFLLSDELWLITDNSKRFVNGCKSIQQNDLFLYINVMILTYYSPVLLFYTPWKHQKTSGGIAKKHQAAMC